MEVISKKLLILVVLSALPLLATGQTPEEEITEIVISQKVPGPPLWQVRNGDNILWIFGSLSPLPKRLDWDTNRVERVIESADAYLSEPGIKGSGFIGPFKGFGLYRQYRGIRKNDNGERLDDILSEELYERLATVKAEYGPWGNGLYKLTPLFAAQRISSEAIDDTGLRDSRYIIKKVEKLVKRHDVPIISSDYEVEVSSFGSVLEEVGEIPLSSQIACLESTLEFIEEDLDAMSERATAWSNGYMDKIYSMDFPNTQANCILAITSGEKVLEIRQGGRELWMANAIEALESNEDTFAVLSMFELLDEQGLLAQLREAGYEIKIP